MSALSRTAFTGITYGVMGMGTEGGATPYQITVAANGGWGGSPIKQSGYSIGAMQFDFGQRGKGIDSETGKSYSESFVDKVNEWARESNNSLLSSSVVADLNTKGRTIKWLSDADRATISAFGDTAEGKGWVNNHLEKGLISEYEAKINPIVNGTAFSGWSDSDILVATAVLTKAANQSPNGGFAALASLTKMNHVNGYTLDDFLTDTKTVELTNSTYHFTKAAEIAKDYVVLRESPEFGPIIESAERQIADPGFTPASIGSDGDLWFMRKVNSDSKFRNDILAAVTQLNKNDEEPSVFASRKSLIALVPEDNYFEVLAPKGKQSVIIKDGEAYFYPGGDVEARRTILKAIELSSVDSGPKSETDFFTHLANKLLSNGWISNFMRDVESGLTGLIASLQMLKFVTGKSPFGDLFDHINGINDIQYDPLGNPIGIDPNVAQRFTDAQRWRFLNDPLMLDLDGDGLEVKGANFAVPILFDHQANGTKTAGGWVMPDDAFLVRDINGNGVIDNGRELFGDNTPLRSGAKAADGLQALADLDDNKDGVVDARDAAFASLKTWRDLNQDGKSQAGELKSLTEAGITSLSVQRTANSVTRADGNRLGDTAHYVTADGKQHLMGEVDLVADTFNREFTQALPISAAAKVLPQMDGSGAVRSLEEAATQSSAVLEAAGRYAGAKTLAQQEALIDQLLSAWADTAGMAANLQARAPMVALNGPNKPLSPAYVVMYSEFNGRSYVDYIDHWEGSTMVMKPEWNRLINDYEHKMHVLESFNGQYFYTLPSTDDFMSARAGITRVSAGAYSGSTGSLPTPDVVSLNVFAQQVTQVEAAYQALQTSVLDSLALQTRLRPLLDLLNLQFDEKGGMQLDSSGVRDKLMSQLAQDPRSALVDILVWEKYLGRSGGKLGADAANLLVDAVAQAPLTPEILQVYQTYGVSVPSRRVTAAAVRLVVGSAQNDTLQLAAAGRIVAGAGADILYGSAGDDVLVGGKGVDAISGGAGSDIFSWAKGDGNDVLTDYDTLAGNIDTLKLTDVSRDEVQLSRDASHLYITVTTTGEKIQVANHFSGAAYNLERIEFSSGDPLLLADLNAVSFRGTDGADVITGSTGGDVLIGGKGVDALYGGLGGDTYIWQKGDGNDTINDIGAATDIDTLKLADVKAADIQLSRDTANLYVTIGTEKITIKDHFGAGYYAAPIEQILFADGGKWQKADLDAAFYRGGDGTDTIYGAASAETFLGGKGADALYGGAGGDTYIWQKGDGNDTINDIGAATDIDTLKLVDAKAADAVLSRDTANLYVTIGTEKITIKDHFTTGYAAAPIEQILFADGGKLQKAELDAAFYRGGDGVDTIYGTASAETFLGGKGADILYGGFGGDTYTWQKGDGNDTINDLGAIADVDTLKLVDAKAADAVLSRDTANLYVTIGTEKITIKDHFTTGYAAAPIEQILFADGSKLQKAELDAAFYRGGDGTDTIYGTASAETFLGGKGADALYGGAGGDTYIWQKGDGNDTINDLGTATDIDTLNLADVKAADVQLSRDTANLYVTIGTEKITVKDHFGAGYYAAPIEQILFADGSKLQKAELDAAFYRGGDGANAIYGAASAETFLGGKGADILYGGFGGDIDTLKLSDVKMAEAVLSRDTVNLYVTVGAEKITIKDHFGAGYYAAPIEQILFADGSKLQKAELDAAFYRGGDGADAIYGTASAETFLGGKGVDALYGGAGGDTYIWQKGDGNDTINDLGAIADVDTLKLVDAKVADVQLSRDTANLYVFIGAEKITVKDHFTTGYAAAPIEQILFADGVKWQKADLDATPYRGGDGADTIYGSTAAETFVGGKGADILYGGFGGDTYTWQKGDGNDTINDLGAATDIDTLKLVDAKAADAVLSRDTANLYVTIGTEKITIKDHFSAGYAAAPIEQVLFADGVKLQKADLDAAFYRGGDGADAIYGTASAETFLGGKGTDTLYGGAGGDNQYHVEQIKSGDGKVLQDTQVDKLVQAMAGFTPPAMGLTALTAAQQTALAPALAANWH